jgi:hypothetical protein
LSGQNQEFAYFKKSLREDRPIKEKIIPPKDLSSLKQNAGATHKVVINYV